MSQPPAPETPTLRLGITMAGAVSAGAYTAGVIDYLFEALQKWEKEKSKEENIAAQDKKVPPHRVVIDVIGGASAGGINAALAALACYSGIVPVTDPKLAQTKDFKPENNLLFNAWVNLAGGKNIPEAIFRMLDNADLRESNGIPALLNSKTIDEVANDAVNHVTSVPRKEWPAFIAKNVEVLLTLCSLRGIPVGIDFNSDNSSWSAKPSHQMSIHKQYARFAPEHQIADRSRAIPFDISERKTLEKFVHCSIASAAFPVGFPAREVTLSRNHIKHQFGKFYQFGDKALDLIFESETVPDPFEFTSVDGGALNNEPFGEIAAIMKEREIKDFALILVDPFPNFGAEEEKYKPLQYLRDLIFPLVGALRNQGMLKETDLREFGRREEVRATYKKNMIYPTRWCYNRKTLEWEKQRNAMACGSLSGFSGILSRDFRVHDYFLGRQNCRNFLHSYFTIEYYTNKTPEENHPIFKDWTPQMRDRFRVQWRDEPEKDVIHLPIIPMLDLMEKEAQIVADLTGKTAKEIEAALQANARATAMAFPGIGKKELRALRFPIAKRVMMMAHKMTGNLHVLIKLLVWIFLLLTLPFLLGYAVMKLLGAIRNNLDESGLLKKDGPSSE